MAWDIHYKKGIWLPQIGWWLDAQHRVDRAMVSHAHGDHIARHKEILCSPATARLLQARLPGKRIVTAQPYGRPCAIDFNATATLHPAGHILGSSLIEVKSDEGTLLYTGDFKLRAGYAAEPCATPAADVLIIESTFGLPHYVFPPEEEVVASLIAFCRDSLAHGSTPVLHCYSLGKSQEVLRALAPSGLPVMLHDRTAYLTRIYEQLGMVFPPYREFEAREVAGHVVICPPIHNGGGGLLNRLPARRTAMITGWAIDPQASRRFRCDAAFPLSDHADFNDLITFVGRVNPKRVLTVHGFTREFARSLRERGWDAHAIDEQKQVDLPLHLGA